MDQYYIHISSVNLSLTHPAQILSSTCYSPSLSTLFLPLLFALFLPCPSPPCFYSLLLSSPPHLLSPLHLVLSFPLYSSSLIVFAWETYEHGTDIHPLADPTKLELMHKDFHVKKGDFKDEQQQSVLDKYGGEEHLNAPPKELLLAQTVSVCVCACVCV